MTSEQWKEVLPVPEGLFSGYPLVDDELIVHAPKVFPNSHAQIQKCVSEYQNPGRKPGPYGSKWIQLKQFGNLHLSAAYTGHSTLASLNRFLDQSGESHKSIEPLSKPRVNS